VVRTYVLLFLAIAVLYNVVRSITCLLFSTEYGWHQQLPLPLSAIGTQETQQSDNSRSCPHTCCMKMGGTELPRFLRRSCLSAQRVVRIYSFFEFERLGEERLNQFSDFSKISGSGHILITTSFPDFSRILMCPRLMLHGFMSCIRLIPSLLISKP